MDFYQRHGRNARLTCRHFGISPDTLYRRRYDPRYLQRLEDSPATRRPRRVRWPQTALEIVEAIRALWETYPRCLSGHALLSPGANLAVK